MNTQHPAQDPMAVAEAIVVEIAEDVLVAAEAVDREADQEAAAEEAAPEDRSLAVPFDAAAGRCICDAPQAAHSQLKKAGGSPAFFVNGTLLKTKHGIVIGHVFGWDILDYIPVLGDGAIFESQKIIEYGRFSPVGAFRYR